MKSKHEHSWTAFTAVPMGERKGKYRQCTDPACGVIGHTKQNNFPGGDRNRLKVYPYKCSIAGCSNFATERRHGRGSRGALIWVCGEHPTDSGK